MSQFPNMLRSLSEREHRVSTKGTFMTANLAPSTSKIKPRPLPRILRLRLQFTLWAAALLCASVAKADANSFKTINNPGGGQVVYGPLPNVTTNQAAMSQMLKFVHGRFGDLPTVDKFFQRKGSNSVATIFRLTAKTQGNKSIQGMIIVSVPKGSKTAAAALLYDDASRFGKTQPALMRSLDEAWSHEIASGPTGSGMAAGNNAGNGPGGVFGVNIPPDKSLSQPLHLGVNPDNSGSIGLPEGWRITSGGGGTLHAEGPHGESLHMGVLAGNNYDPQTQQGASMISYMRRGSTPFTACSMTQNLFQDWQCVSTQTRQRNHLPPVQVRLISSKFDPKDQMQGAFLAETDFSDGKGTMMTSLRLGAQRMGPGTWLLTMGQANVPRNLADAEWPTIQAMIMTYRQNSAVIQQETAAIIRQINAAAEANRKLADARTQANDAHNAQYWSDQDAKAQANKAFENYTLDYSVLHDPSDGRSWGRTDYPTAEFLIKADPDHFKEAGMQELIPGVDYRKPGQ